MQEPCQYHQDLVNNMTRFIESVNELRKDQQVIGDEVRRISVALIGDFDKQGMIGKVDKQIADMANDIKVIQEWRSEIEGIKKAIIVKVFGAGISAILAGATIAVVIIKVIQ